MAGVVEPSIGHGKGPRSRFKMGELGVCGKVE